MKAVFLSAILAVSAGGAWAASPEADVLAGAVVSTSGAVPVTPSTLDLSRPRAASRFASPLPAGIAKTSVDHRFGDDEAVGSFGYLCGLNPGQKMTGAAGAAGYDPMGKFLGAKLSFAFR
jgi:hypothetical protein